MATTGNLTVLVWVQEMAALTKPDSVVWIDGSQDQLEALRKQATASGELIRLHEGRLPGCYLHRSDPNDVARVEQRTFICSRREEDAGPTNNWRAPADMYATLSRLFDGCMRGRTMYVIPYSMAVPGSSFARFGVEVTDSIYVVLSMAIMTRIGTQVLDRLNAQPIPAKFTKGLHAKATLNPNERFIAHFPEDNTIWSINSAYGGNALFGKKCFALRVASCLGRDNGWLAEHMLILGIERPNKEVFYLAAAFPSACGKTNLAMLIPPELYRKKGYKVWCVGDDIAWLRPGPDGRLWAVNPEAGFFGVAPGTSMKTNPNALHACQSNSIFTNVVHNLDDNTVWWEGLDKNPPANAVNWCGEPWDATDGTKGAHPNSRFTAPAHQCPCISAEFEAPDGVPISAIVFGGRRAKTTPLVYQSRNWAHGVFVGSIMASETTAAASGAIGVVRRDPMAMLPFCGYHMGDYFAHWLEVGANISNPPKIFNVNWFQTDDDGRFLWPGFGENLRVLDWIADRCLDEAPGAASTSIGYIPEPQALNLDGLKVDTDDLRKLLHVDQALWRKETEDIWDFYASLGAKLPAALRRELDELTHRIGK